MIIVVVTNKNMTEQSSSKKGEGAQKVFLLKWIRNFSLTLEIYFRDEMIQDSMLAQGGGGGGGGGRFDESLQSCDSGYLLYLMLSKYNHVIMYLSKYNHVLKLKT